LWVVVVVVVTATVVAVEQAELYQPQFQLQLVLPILLQLAAAVLAVRQPKVDKVRLEILLEQGFRAVVVQSQVVHCP
jgi:hypothetical protein